MYICILIFIKIKFKFHTVYFDICGHNFVDTFLMDTFEIAVDLCFVDSVLLFCRYIFYGQIQNIH